jgi:fucose permease
MVVFGVGFGALDTALNVHAAGLGWRGVFATQAAVQAVVAVLLSLTWRAAPTSSPVSSAPPGLTTPPIPPTPRARTDALLVLLAAAFAAVECGIESGAGVWGYVFLTVGRGLSGPAAAGTVSAYWATMFAGRAVLGPVAERFGPGRVLTGGVAGLVAGAVLLTVPGPAALPVAGLAVVGLAAAPIFPLLTLTTAERTGAADTTRAISLQVAASAGGNAALPAALGLVIGALTASALGPALLLLSLLLAGLHGWLGRRTGEAGAA